MRLGVDVGGTFTDLVCYDDQTGEIIVGKGATTADAPEIGVLDVVDNLEDIALSDADLFLHATTVGINALLERKGAVVGLLTTEGFRDVLELRRGDREAMYDNLWRTPEPLVPRRLRHTVRERIRADGRVERELERSDIENALQQFGEVSVASIAILFINAYANPAHELEAERVLRELGFEGDISLSHRVSGEYREYERGSTTVIDAYVRPKVSSYLRRLDEGLSRRGFRGESLITRSGGGAMAFREAEGRPFEIVMSGPVAGAVGAATLAKHLGFEEAITADVGGTSFDTCLVTDGRPRVKYEGSVAGMPILSPWIDVRSIGAGGGSVAYVDDGGLLRVGPRSAGAVPGPVSYRRGGTEPTVTDAAAVLGMLGEGELAGGVKLDIPGARDALAALGSAIDLSGDEVAKGIVTIVSAAMANEIRSVTVEQGRDPREAILIAFGGAGPMFATLLATDLGISTVAIPPHAGNFSALSLLDQDIVRTTSITLLTPLDGEGLGKAHQALDDLRAVLSSRRTGEDVNTRVELLEPALDLRYVGQEYTLTLPFVVDDMTVAQGDETPLADEFARTYDRTFGHKLDEEIEIVTVRLASRTQLGNHPAHRVPTFGDKMTSRHMRAFSHTQSTIVDFEIVPRSAITLGSLLNGPAIVLEETTTTYLDAGFSAHLDESATLILKADNT